MRVFLGYDSREPIAYLVAADSLQRTSRITAEPLFEWRLRQHGLLTRPVDQRGHTWDLVSNAPCSTEFAISRFLVPILCPEGWALFADSDVVFLRSVHELAPLLDPDKAVMVVKHRHEPEGHTKMDAQQQLRYPRKNWSSVMAINCDHPAHARLSLHDVNSRPGLALHSFYWLADSEIGELPPAWNWLVNEQPQPANTAIAHFTNGGPFTPGWRGAPNDDIWERAWERLQLQRFTADNSNPMERLA